MAKSHSIAQAKYDSTHCKYFSFKFNLETDADIIAKLAEQESMQGYIKQLIRDDIARTCSASAPKTEEEEKKMYHIKPEYLDLWQGNDTPSDPDRIITEEDLRTFSEEWDIPVEKLLEQLEEI